jgi:UDP-2,3-diacylglucosamine pyrophosphatase LpxH
MGEEVALGMHNVLANDPTIRYAIAGHTHQLRFDPGSDERQTTYFNTSSWTNHLALPNSTEVTPELVSWLQAPDWRNFPLYL